MLPQTPYEVVVAAVIVAVASSLIALLLWWLLFARGDTPPVDSTTASPRYSPTPRSQSHPIGDEDDDGYSGYHRTYGDEDSDVGQVTITSSGGLSLGLGHGMGIDPTDGSLTINVGRGFSIDTDGK